LEAAFEVTIHRNLSATLPTKAMTTSRVSQSQDDLYREAVAAYGDALDRLVRAYEMHPDRRRDLLQEIHVALWRSFETFEARCSVRTWVYRIAHNVATSYVIRQHRTNAPLLSLDEIDTAPRASGNVSDADNRMDFDRLLQLIHQLQPPDREIMLLYLEDLDAPAIGEIMGLSAVNVRSKIHRIKTALARRFHSRGQR
jgi:RNA polymerase sigma-70 factor (ECF subfamily)